MSRSYGFVQSELLSIIFPLRVGLITPSAGEVQLWINQSSIAMSQGQTNFLGRRFHSANILLSESYIRATDSISCLNEKFKISQGKMVLPTEES